MARLSSTPGIVTVFDTGEEGLTGRPGFWLDADREELIRSVSGVADF